MESKLHSVFRYRNFRELPHMCSPDLFLAKNSDKQTCLHVAATCDGFSHIPTELLTAENLLQRDGSGDTPIHLAAFVGKLESLPLGSLSREVFYAKDGDGKSVIKIARDKGILSQIPISILLADSTYQYDSILSYISSNEITEIDQQLMDPAMWSRTSPGVRLGPTLYHVAAESGILDQLPDEMLPSDVFKLRNHLGETPLHVAARSLKSGSLERAYSRVPQAFDWTDQDASGNTILHCVAQSGQLASVPDGILTEQAVTIRNNNGKSVLDLAFEANNLEVVPLELRFLCDPYARKRLNEALVSGDCADIPASLFSLESLERLLPHRSGKSSALHVAALHGTLHLLPSEAFSEEFLKGMDDMGLSPLHIAAATGKLENIPAELFTYEQLSRPDRNGRTPCHVVVSAGHLGKLPLNVLSQDLLLISDNEGVTCFHLGAPQLGLGGIPISLFSREALLAEDKAGQSVADIVEKHGNTPLLPPHLRNFSKARALIRLKECFSQDFVSSAGIHERELAELINLEEFQLQRRNFALEWSDHYPDLALDEEQAEAVAEYGPHVQVTARAGSGKTRTLVARALFHITHCRIPASSILILAFNRKAVDEIRERLSKYLDEERMPHVLTFHALAYRIVRPEEELIYDEGETKEGQVFSATIQQVIDTELRSGSLEHELRSLMEARWAEDLTRIIQKGYDLPQDKFLEFRGKLPRVTISGRRVTSEVHKYVGNVLVRHRFGYSYRKSTYRFAGASYVPDFSHYNKETDRRIIVEVLGDGGAEVNPAREAFWKSDLASNALLIQMSSDTASDEKVVSLHLVNSLQALGIVVSPMSDDELWDVVKKRAIDDFTKGVKGFISRCQKELISPAQLNGLVENMAGHCIEIQERFWLICGKIYSRYLSVLTAEKKTDFDQLMLNAATMIKGGHTRFSSSRGAGDLSRIKHLLIDEFQDFSHLFNELRKAFITHSPDALFFCVGDDWQAINKFAGSDLRYFTGFRDSFQPSVRKLISTNYRSSIRIVETGNHVMKGEGDPSIPKSTENGNVSILQTDGETRYSEVEEIVAEELGDQAIAILRAASEALSRGLGVAILSRTSSFATPDGMLKIEAWEKRLRQYLPEDQRKRLNVSTTHGYKGKEADVVILLAPESYPLVHPDAIFSTIFGDTFESNVADEKRLFYVGVTRPRTQLLLLPDQTTGATQSADIPFLPGARPATLSISRITSRLVCGDKVIVRLANAPGCPFGSGTFPIKDQLKSGGYKWPKDDSKIWSRILDPGSISSPFECTQYLQRQPWIKDADGILATFAWEDQRHSMRINKGTVVPDGSSPQTQGGPMSIGGHWKPIEGWTGQTTSSTRPSSSAVRPTASRPTHGASPPPVTLATNLNQDERPVKSSGAAPGVFRTSVAGMRYEGRMEQASHLSVGNFVRLEREPGNTHDRNAIQVLTTEGAQIGYLSRHVAAHLAAGLDAWGGTSQAKVTSVWTQPLPHFLVSIQICFPLPPGVVIPPELDAAARLEDNPFVDTRPPAKSVSTAPLTTLERQEPEREKLGGSENGPDPSLDSLIPATASPDEPPSSRSGVLTQAQEVALGDLLDSNLGSLITDLYLSGCCPWPYIGYEGLDAQGRCTDSTLEVAWPDFKVGIALPTNEVSRFEATGWTILPAATVTASAIQRLFATATEAAPSPAQESTNQADEPTTATDLSPSIGDFPTSDRNFQHGPFIDDEPDDDIPY